MPWYTGPTLMAHLETTPLHQPDPERGFSMPVQWVNRPNLDFRGFAGQVASGVINVGDAIKVLPSGKQSTVQSIVTFDGDLQTAVAGQSITLTLKDEIDISRGDVIVSQTTKVEVARNFLTTLLWMNESQLVPGREYWIKTRAKLLTARLTPPSYALNINTLDKEDVETLGLNEIGQCELILDQDIAFQTYQTNHHLGSFIIIDKQSNNTVGMGLIDAVASKKDWVDHYIETRNKYWVKGHVNVEDRKSRYGHDPKLILITGDAEKAVFEKHATELEVNLFNKNKNVYRYGFQYMGSPSQEKPLTSKAELRTDMIQSLIQIAYAFLDAGHIFITAIPRLTDAELASIQNLAAPHDVEVIKL